MEDSWGHSHGLKAGAVLQGILSLSSFCFLNCFAVHRADAHATKRRAAEAVVNGECASCCVGACCISFLLHLQVLLWSKALNFVYRLDVSEPFKEVFCVLVRIPFWVSKLMSELWRSSLFTLLMTVL